MAAPSGRGAGLSAADAAAGNAAAAASANSRRRLMASSYPWRAGPEHAAAAQLQPRRRPARARPVGSRRPRAVRLAVPAAPAATTTVCPDGGRCRRPADCSGAAGPAGHADVWPALAPGRCPSNEMTCWIPLGGCV